MKKIFLLACCLYLSQYVNINAQVSDPLPFMSRFTPRSAIITDYTYKDTIPSNCGLIPVSYTHLTLPTILRV